MLLFDIQTFTSLVLNDSLSATEFPDASYVRGVSSGATGYSTASYSLLSAFVKLPQFTGNFING